MKKLLIERFQELAGIKPLYTEQSDTDDYGRSISGKDKSTSVEPEDLMPAARARKLGGMEESKPTVEERTAVLNYYLAKSPSRSQLPDIFDLTKENYKGNDPLILSYIEKIDQDIPYRILRQENVFFQGELIRMLNHPDDQEYIQDWKNTLETNRIDPFGNKLTPQNHDYIADVVKADPDLAETKTLKEIGMFHDPLGYSPGPDKTTTAGEFEVNVPVQNEMEKVKIKYGHATGPLEDVTISWGNESHNVDFEEGDEIEDHGNEGKDISFVAYSQDDIWRFIVDVSVEVNYELSGNIQDINWDTLEIVEDR
jgi:hypothetical protein